MSEEKVAKFLIINDEYKFSKEEKNRIIQLILSMTQFSTKKLVKTWYVFLIEVSINKLKLQTIDDLMRIKLSKMSIW